MEEMHLRTVSVRVKWGKRKLKKIVSKTVRSAFSCSFEVWRLMKLLISISLTSNVLIALVAPFGYRSLSNGSEITPCECSVVYTSLSYV